MDNPVFKLEGVVHERSAEALQAESVDHESYLRSLQLTVELRRDERADRREQDRRVEALRRVLVGASGPDGAEPAREPK